MGMYSYLGDINNVHSILKRYTERENRLSQKEEIAKSEISKFEVRWVKI